MTGATPIQLVPLRDHAPEPAFIEELASALESYLGTGVEVIEPIDLPSEARQDQQLSSNTIVDTLIAQFPAGDGFWRLALTDADLAAPGRSFVFGEAALGGEWAVVSSARLRVAGQPGGKERVFKEVLHELGHLAGLGHCSRVTCVMCRSTSPADVDSKLGDFCETCVARFFRSGRS